MKSLTVNTSAIRWLLCTVCFLSVADLKDMYSQFKIIYSSNLFYDFCVVSNGCSNKSKLFVKKLGIKNAYLNTWSANKS